MLSLKSIAIITLCLLALVVGANALAINGISIQLQESGDATIQANYDLTIPEYLAIQFNLFSVKEKIEQKAREISGKDIVVQSIDTHAITVSVPALSNKSPDMGTPEISLMGYKAGEILVQYPDGYQERFGTVDKIPATRHYVYQG